MRIYHNSVLLLIIIFSVITSISFGCSGGGESGHGPHASRNELFVLIYSPLPEEIYVVGEQIPFEVFIEDYRTRLGKPGEFSVTWESDKDGVFWVGDIEAVKRDSGERYVEQYFTSSVLSEGTHVITCRAVYWSYSPISDDQDSVTITVKKPEVITTPFNHASIQFKTVNSIERPNLPLVFEDDVTGLGDGGHEGHFSGNTYTLDYESLDLYSHVRNIREINIALNDQHDLVTSVEFHRSEDDEDEASDYKVSEFFRAYNIPLISSYSTSIVFRLEAVEVCDAIEQYKYIQTKYAGYEGIEALDHCTEDSWLRVELKQE